MVPSAPVLGEPVSLLKLVVNCDDYEGKEVTVNGAGSFGFEDHRICPTKEFLDSDSMSCLWLTTDGVFSGEVVDRLARRVKRGASLTIDATVSCKERGHLAMGAGGLVKISLVVDRDKSRVLWERR
jgi:hypothetical protein